MKLPRTSLLAVLVAALALLTFAPPASAQVYYSTPMASAFYVEPAYPLPSPNYVVYSPTFLAWRSAGYYCGNWGPYYYNPPAMAPYISVNMIRPIRVDASPPVYGYYYGR